MARRTYIYFAATVDRALVKIGISETPMRRVDGLKSQSPIDIEFLAFAPGTEEDERRLHKIFAPFRAHHEWYRWCNELSAVIVHTRERCALPCNLGMSVHSDRAYMMSKKVLRLVPKEDAA